MALIDDRVKRAYTHGEDAFSFRLYELIYLFWLDKDIDLHIQSLRSNANDRGRQAIVELLLGQLLLSRKLVGALDHLNLGFQRAIPYLSSEDYFVVLKRHQQLSWLPLTAEPSEPFSLEMLLTEARVIERLSRSIGKIRKKGSNPSDTVG